MHAPMAHEAFRAWFVVEVPTLLHVRHAVELRMGRDRLSFDDVYGHSFFLLCLRKTIAMDGSSNNDDDLLAQELKFAQAGLEAAQKLRERNRETLEAAAEPSTTSSSAVATRPPPPPELLQTADDILPNDDDADEDEDEKQNVRDVDGNVGPAAQLDAPEDYYDELEEDVKDLGFARGVKLPEPVGMRAMNDLTMSDIRQSAMLAQLRRREANYLDNVKSLNITNLRLHASEFASVRLREESKCEILVEMETEDVKDKEGNVINTVTEVRALQIPFTGSLEFLDTDEEREMFHNLDGRPWLDREPDWLEKRKTSLKNWLEKIDKFVDKNKDNSKEEILKNAKQSKIYLNVNEFVGWTYLYRFMAQEEVADYIKRLTNYLLPEAVFKDFKDFNWFIQRSKFLKEVALRMPSDQQMQRFETELASLEDLRKNLEKYDERANKEEQENILSYTWSYMFLLLIYRQVMAHEFFMFCVYKRILAPELDAVDSALRETINFEESIDDIMHTKWQEILDKFALFRDILTGRQDPFTFHFKNYMTLAHQRLKINHERNMVRSEDAVYKVAEEAASNMDEDKRLFDKNLFNPDVANFKIDNILKQKLFNNLPKIKVTDKEGTLIELKPQTFVERVREGVKDTLNFVTGPLALGSRIIGED